MKVALVHDYLKEYGGAERVLEALAEIYPRAPIYTAFYVKDSAAGKAFADREIITSWANSFLPWHNLYSPLRFLTPLIWESFDLSDYDLVISSTSWYITKSVITKPETLHLCYCHTPPRWLYGYQTAKEWQRFLPVRIYGEVLAHFLRQYDYLAAQRVDYFIANSENTRQRIKKFYRRDSTVIYPPISEEFSFHRPSSAKSEKQKNSESSDLSDLSNIRYQPTSADSAGLSENYYLVVSRLAAPKNIHLAIEACNKLKEELWIVGSGPEEKYLKSIAGPTIKFLGQVSDRELWEIYSDCKALLATATDEDFGITPVEAMSAGRPVIAYRGGGYLESVVEGKTGLFFDESKVDSLSRAISHYNNIYYHSEKRTKKMSEDCRKQAEKFSKERFKQEIIQFVEQKLKEHHA
ncbi:glycosyltransferase [Candidatus Gottesmanbacteria bacterium]|nr:glycosyltransferase [Candidatus Gottesmanbacteria bacterium]